MMYKYLIPLLGLVTVSYGYIRELINMGDIPINARLSYAACADGVEIVKPSEAIKVESGGCCLKGITLSAEGYEPVFFGLSASTAIDTVYDMIGTGAGIACKDTRFVFWNDSKTHGFATPRTIFEAGEIDILDYNNPNKGLTRLITNKANMLRKT